MVKSHINRAYNNELRNLRDRIQLITQRVEKMLGNTIKAMVENDEELARATIDYDKNVDRDELVIDRICIEILARRQPLGHDLRFVVSVIKMVTYFERLGDLAAKICQRVIKLNRAEKHYDVKALEEMAHGVQDMIKDTVYAFMNEDYEKALFVLRQDRNINELYHAASKYYIQEMSSPEFENYHHLLSIARWLERMGDHCTNLAELIIFMIKGEDIRHKVIDTESETVS